MREVPLGHGNRIIGFDSLEEILEYQANAEREAIQSTLPPQWEIAEGDRVFRLVGELAIFGHILTRDEFLGEDPDEELLDEWSQFGQSYVKGYRYGRWYSVVEPTGEYGSAHVASLWKITPAEFARAQAEDWHAWPELIERVAVEIAVARKGRDETDRQ